MPASASPSPPASPGRPAPRSRPSFAIAYPPPASSSARTVPAAAATKSPPAPPHPKHFVAPAHPQSHHLHSLPPREKTTRTLILDHTAWQHARTRFAQGRCELAMRVRFKRKAPPKRDAADAVYIGAAGPSAFGNPPEVELASSDDEGDDEDGRESDREDVAALRYGTRAGPAADDADGAARAAEHAALAPVLAARATGIEKVLHAMLAQPPSPPPRSPSPPPYALHSAHAHSQHYRPPPAAPARARAAAPPRTLPNGVRLRLALLALVNDLLERQPPPAPDDLPASPTRPQTSGSSNASESARAAAAAAPSPPCSPTQLPPPSLPPPNVLLSSLVALTQVSRPPAPAPPTLPSFHTLALPSSSSGGSTLSPISGTGIRSPSKPSKSAGDGTPQTRRPPPQLFTWTPRPSGEPPSPDRGDADRAATSSPISPRAPAAASRTLPTSWHARHSRTGPARRGARELYAAGCHAPRLCPRHLRARCAICAAGARPAASHIGAGLLRCGGSGGGGGAGSLAAMVPRLLRLSALVAMELGREARGEEADADADAAGEREREGGSARAASTAASSAGAARAAQPTRAWYALLCGVLTRAVLEGYVGRAWRGAEHAEVLLGVGLGVQAGGAAAAAAAEEDAGEFEPDEMPGLADAGRVLFAGDEDDEDADAAEYRAEMEARLAEFLTIPPATPDLAAHLAALSAQYPAEPVERAALRFCEAVARWRGPPELETYKARPATPGALPIHALLASPRPPIERYFRAAPPSGSGGGSGGVLRKRARGGGGGEERAPKRERVELDLGESPEGSGPDVGAEWVGPYGV